MRHNGEDPLRILLAARPAFGSSSEADHLANLTAKILSPGKVNWLEVGAGDGHHLAFQMKRLSARRRIRAVALEPSVLSQPEMSSAVTWLRLPVEEYEPNTHLDWINMRHCAYYLSNPILQIERLVSCLSYDGALALTHWSRDCVLHRLHLAICGSALDAGVAGIEDLRSMLSCKRSLIVSEVEYHNTTLLIDRVVADPVVGVALFELVRRGRTSLFPVGTDRASMVAHFLQGMARADLRRNGALLVRKRFN